MSDAITMDQVKEFAAAWYRALDQHVPLEQAYSFLADHDLNVRFPDGDIVDRASFRRWYDAVTNRYFDENHTVQSVEGTISDALARVRVVVGWQASWIEPPAAKSKRTSMDATQDWIVRSSTKNAYGLEIVSYNATALPFSYAPGFARL